MKKVVLRSFLVVFLLLGMFHGKVSAAESTKAAQPVLTVMSTKLPVYRSFEELSDFRIHTSSDYVRYKELSFNDKVTILEEKEYAANIRMSDGTTGWVHKAYLTSNIESQTWLVKEWRNIRETPSSTKFIGNVPSHSKVYVLDYDADTNYFLIKTTNGVQGWIYGLYLENESTKLNKGSNVIPYNFSQEGKSTNQITLFTPLNTVANVTANQMNQFIFFKTKGVQTLMSNMGSTYLKAQSESGLNAIYLLAHSGLESKWGTSDIVKAKNNFYGIGADDSQPADRADSFSSPSNGIVSGADWIKKRYVDRDQYMEDYPFPQPTLDNMRFNSNLHQYSTDEAWASKIAQIANEFSSFTSAAGWKTWDGHWYYFTNDWTLKKGWLLDKNKWYYLNQSGVMVTGWQYINGKWYYLNPSGEMRTGWLYSGGKWYFLNPTNGDMKTGWLSTGGKWYYLNSSGAMQTGWIWVGGKWYYLYKDGHMAANTTVGGYRLGRDGAML